ncbi:uncharacterized protein G2W53_025318 [Senna tora]|uniref:Uncharacterized protein n=1 Tax=Senna tora TaxID=362788 RepID=A0A834TDA9_9FABA|nr:uncharacterized protein G2W53_025318 [Senna tora]
MAAVKAILQQRGLSRNDGISSRFKLTL